jgi:hypothetical protein
MSSPVEQGPGGEPPQWAIERARGELYDVSDQVAILERAREIVREAAVLEEERHDEYDDPDQGGEG